MFTDRIDAGRRLGASLEYLRCSELLVLGLPRGGVPVAAEVAAALDAPLDVLVIRKLGAPRNPEYAIGAIGSGGVRVLDSAASRRYDPAEVDAVETRERAELERRILRYRPGRPPLELSGRSVVIVDDGLATGSTAKAACRVARQLGATELTVAVPVAPRGWSRLLDDEADRFVAVHTPVAFFAVGQFYSTFPQTSDDEVLECLALSG